MFEHTAELGSGADGVSSFGVDASGELYLVSYPGAIYRLASDVEAPPPAVACVGPDPFVTLGGGTCCNGGWLPPGKKPAFAHGLLHRFPPAPFLLCSFHPSQQNTFTGRLTPAMLRGVFDTARRELSLPQATTRAG